MRHEICATQSRPLDRRGPARCPHMLGAAVAALPLMRSADWIGWFSSGVLLLTLAHQVRKQWREGRSDGVSPWLFVGQIFASLGFLTYSVLVGNWVFSITNGLLILNSVVGYGITRHQQRRAAVAPHSPRIERHARSHAPTVSSQGAART
jgi:MtN3 and saliva related transmembrane protein